MQKFENKFKPNTKICACFIFVITVVCVSISHAATLSDASPEEPLSSADFFNSANSSQSVNSRLIEAGENKASIINKPSVLPDDENNIRLLELSIGPYRLENLVMVYQYKEILFVPFGALSELLDLAVKTNPSMGIAKGFIFKQNRTFYLDVNRGEVTLSGAMKSFDVKRTAIRQLDDIYIDSDLLSEWLPLKIDIDLYSSRLKIIPDEPLPFMLRKEREGRIKVTQSSLVPKDRGYPRYTALYEAWTYPHINFNARAGVYKNNLDETGRTYSHVTYATADLFNMESAWYLSGDQDKLFDDFRVTFGRKDTDSGLLGYAKASEYAFGHVVEPRINLINRPLSVEPGAYISNYPLTRQQQYDTHSFSGDLPPGWEVELYRNNSLLNYQSVSINGRYEFNDVPLLFGHNYFRLVFYGPQGQIKEESQTFELGQSLTIPGKQYYRLMTTKDEDFGNRTLLQYDIGINKHLSLTAGFLNLPIDKDLLISMPEKEHKYLTGGIRGFHNSVFYKLDYISDNESGTAKDWELQSRLGPVILDISNIYFDKFVSEVFNETLSPIERRSEIKLNTAIPTKLLSSIPVSLELRRDSYEDGNWNSQIVNRISAQKYNYAVTNSLALASARDTEDVFSGNLSVSRRAKKYNLRTSLGYQIKPDKEFTSVSLSADGFKLWGFHAIAGITKIINSDEEQINFGLNREMDGYTLGMVTRASTDGTFSFEFTFNMGLIREPRMGQWKKTAKTVANQGAISAQVFLDRNGDGKKDDDEEPLSGVRVNINGGGAMEKTDENGIAFNYGIMPYRQMDFDIALNTLEDPLLLPEKKGMRVDLRPGFVTRLDFPIMLTGEIDGTTYINYDGVKREASGVVLELIDQKGEVIKIIKTAYDGFFVMDKIPVGVFKLRVSEEQIAELGLNPVEPIIVEINAEKQIVNGQNIILTSKQ